MGDGPGKAGACQCHDGWGNPEVQQRHGFGRAPWLSWSGGAAKARPGENCVGQRQNEQAAKEDLVVAGKPHGKEDIKVVGPVRRIAGGHAGQWATAAVEQNDRDLHEHDRNQDERRPQVSQPDRQRNCDDAAGKESPHQRVEGLDREESLGIVHLKKKPEALA